MHVNRLGATCEELAVGGGHGFRSNHIHIYMYTHLYVGARLKDSGKRFL